MGLDMYLSREVYLANYQHDPEGMKLSAAVLKALKAKNSSQYESGSIKISLPAGYWRKANAVHKWFVDNVQDGKDECESHHVSEIHLTTLQNICRKILTEGLSDETTKLLPTQSGFFFGNTDYDENYLEDLRQTLVICERALDPKNSISKYDSFNYCSSW